ncbi:hypothetical protein [Rhizobium sp.]
MTFGLYGITLATALCLMTVSTALAYSKDTHPIPTAYNGQVLLEHADFIPFDRGSLAGYLTIWNGTNSEKIIRSIEVKPLGTAELAKRVSADVVRSMVDASVLTVPPKSELQMGLDTIFLLVKGSSGTDRAEVIVRFNDGSSSKGDGRIVIDRTSLTDHHHPAEKSP